MKNLLLILCLAALVGCNTTSNDTIYGTWTIVKYEESGVDNISQLIPSFCEVTFHNDNVVNICTHDHFPLDQHGYLGNWNAYWVMDDILYDYCTARYQMEFIGNNKVKLTSLVSSGLVVTLRR